MGKLLIICITIFGLKSWSAPQDDLEKIISRSGIKKDHLSLFAVSSSGEELLNVNAKKKMIPASITKLLTSAAVMDAFKPDKQFKTQLLMDSKGNLYLKGFGDPAFVSEKMWVLVNDFLRTKVKKIDGNIICDESYFDDERFDEGRESERNDRAYDAPVSALSFNWNSATVFVRPGAEAGEKGGVWLDSENDYVILKNKTITASRGTDLSAERSFEDGHDVLTVSGKIALGSPEKHIYKNITEPALFAGYNLKSFLKQRGVEVSGKVVKGETPTTAKLMAEVLSDRLYQVATSMNKFSNNFVAEMLAKGLSAELSGKQGKMSVALDKIRAFLKTEPSMSDQDFTLVNVSGFTRKNRFSAAQFVDVLSWVKGNFSIGPEFIHSLPVAGVDGTLEKRFHGLSGERKVRAKTGLLNGVVALSGFASRGRAGESIFAFIFNGTENEAHVREVFDQLASQLAK